MSRPSPVAAALVVSAAVGFAALLAGVRLSGEEPAPSRPPIDTASPVRTETATFALG